MLTQLFFFDRFSIYGTVKVLSKIEKIFVQLNCCQKLKKKINKFLSSYLINSDYSLTRKMTVTQVQKFGRTRNNSVNTDHR